MWRSICFPTDTTDFADFVLPAAGFLEFDDHRARRISISACRRRSRRSSRSGDALPNQEIFRRLARAMSFNEPELYEDDATILDTLARQAGLADFATLEGKGDGRAGTGSGAALRRSQLPDALRQDRAASERAADDGHPALPQPRLIRGRRRGRFRMLSPASPWLMNSSYHEDAKIAGEGRAGNHPAASGGCRAACH